MGITIKELGVLLELKKQGYLDGKQKIIEIGAQQISNNFLEAKELLNQIAQAFQKAKLELPEVTRRNLMHGAMEHLSSDAIYARVFWEWLDFDYTAIDIDDSPGAIP